MGVQSLMGTPKVNVKTRRLLFLLPRSAVKDTCDACNEEMSDFHAKCLQSYMLTNGPIYQIATKMAAMATKAYAETCTRSMLYNIHHEFETRLHFMNCLFFS